MAFHGNLRQLMFQLRADTRFLSLTTFILNLNFYSQVDKNFESFETINRLF